MGRVSQTARAARQVTRSHLHRFVWVYAFLSFLELRAKLQLTPAWFDGRLERNHAALLAFQYVQNEQSRILQFYIPELFVRALGVSVSHAYMIQRWACVAIAFVLFHVYLRKWFSDVLAFAAVVLLAAVMPFSFYNDLQESSALLMPSFLVGLWTIRDGPSWSVALALLVGSLINETTLALASMYFADHFREWRLAELWRTVRRTLAVAAPALVYTAWIRYVTWGRPHPGGARHWGDNVGGILADLRLSPLEYHRAAYLSIFFIFNVLWIFAFLRISEKPRFVRASLLLIPAFVFPHFLTGIIFEVRQMIPLAFVVIPAAFFWMFRQELARDAVERIDKASGWSGSTSR